MISGLVVIVLGIQLYWVQQDLYRQINGLSPVRLRNWFGSEWFQKAEVTFEMLGWERIVLGVVLPTAVYCVLHPYIGRLIVAICRALLKEIDTVFFDSHHGLGTWEPDVLVLCAAAWPLTILTIPVLLFALLMGLAYRSLWS